MTEASACLAAARERTGSTPTGIRTIQLLSDSLVASMIRNCQCCVTLLGAEAAMVILRWVGKEKYRW